MNSSIVRLLYFLLLIPLNWYAFHWLWIAILDSAGIARKDVWEKRARIRNTGRAGAHLSSWIIYNSKNPQKTKKLFRFYSIGLVPIALCVSFAVFGIYSGLFDTVLTWATFVMPVIILTAWVCGLVYKDRQKKSGKVLPERNTLKEDIKTLKENVYDKEAAKQLQWYGGSKKKMWTMGTIKLAVFVVALIGLFFLILNLSSAGHTKKIASYEEMKAAIESRGYTATDMTQQYEEHWKAQKELEQMLVARSGNFIFAYAIFDSDNSASSIWAQYKALAYEDAQDAKITTEDIGNYRIITLQSDTAYKVLVQVGNTFVRATASVEEGYIIREALMETGYFFED